MNLPESCGCGATATKVVTEDRNYGRFVLRCFYHEGKKPCLFVMRKHDGQLISWEEYTENFVTMNDD